MCLDSFSAVCVFDIFLLSLLPQWPNPRFRLLVVLIQTIHQRSPDPLLNHSSLSFPSFLTGDRFLLSNPLGEPVEFNWPFSDPVSELRLGVDFLSLTSGSPFIASIFPPSPCCLLRDLAAGSTMSDSGEEIPTSGEDYQLFPQKLFPGDNFESAVMSTAMLSLRFSFKLWKRKVYPR